MHRYLLLFLVLFTNSLFAQNFQNICTRGTTFYLGQGNAYMAYRQDSVIVVGNNDTTFYSYLTFRDTVALGCADTTNGSLLGHKIIKTQAGWFYFFNRYGDTIRINSLAIVDQSWKFCQLPGNGYLEAKVTSISNETVLGISDPVKVITLQAKDAANNNIPHNLNQKTIKLSQHYGLSKMLDVYSIPNDTSFQVLAGKTNPRLGTQDLTWQEIYNFDIGDVFHFIKTTTTATIRTINRVLTKTTYGIDSVTYTLENCEKIISSTYPYDESIHDTITVKYYFGEEADTNWLCKLPGEFEREDGEEADIFSYTINPSQNRRSKYISWSGYVYSTGNCWKPTDGYLYPIGTGTYTEGLGKTQSYWKHFTGTQWVQMQEDLVYYKKGTESWGSPVSTDCSALFGIEDNSLPLFITVFPNPASDKLMIGRPDQNSKPAILVYDSFGRICFRNDHFNSESIDVSGFAEGIYILRFTEGNLYSLKKFVVAR